LAGRPADYEFVAGARTLRIDLKTLDRNVVGKVEDYILLTEGP
jgi:hypothetical protein